MRYLATVSYDGSNYSGYQIQPDQVTIQSVIEEALKKIHKGRLIKITAAGRTDAGVHANGQTFHFDSTLSIPEANWKRALNALLPNDIVIRKIESVPATFHARYNAVKRTYKYYVLNSDDPSPFQAKYSTYVNQELDLEAMKEACQYLIGQHDFSAFCAANSNVKGDKIRTLYEASCTREGQQICFVFTGNGFLYHMIRIIVGTLLEVGLGKRKPGDIMTIIKEQDRDKAGKTAAPHGLYLDHIKY